jgi:hypothetical protein
MRPETHREQIPEKRCGNCRHALYPEYKRDLLCFCDDEIEIRGPGISPGTTEVWLNGEHIGLLDGDEYDEVWAGRIVDWDDVCDEWELEPQKKE